jgi:hypothetical protein
MVSVGERRRAERRKESVVLRVESEAKAGRVGVTRNCSQTGVLFATPTTFQVGERVTLSRRDPDDPTFEAARGVIVRIVRTNESPMRFLVAVALDPRA